MKQWPEIITALVNLFPKLIGAIIGMVPKLIDAGFQLVKGLAKGMIENIPKLLGEAAAAIGSALTNGVNAVFQIKSPSRVFYGIGENVVKGLQDGIMDGKRLLESASIGMANTVEVSAMNQLGDMNGMQLAPVGSGSGASSSGGMALNLTVNAGMGADGADIGRKIVDEILRFERSSGKVFARA
jgi:hypothetical protein